MPTPDLAGALTDIRLAVDEMKSAASRSERSWTVPRAPGKWSPRQIVEHVSRAVDEFANVAADRPSKFPTFPRFVRPVVRRIFFDRVVRTGKFPKGRTTKPMNPRSGPPTADDGRARLDAALAKLEEASRACAARGGVVVSSIFGRVPLEAFIVFQAAHIRHHCRQMPGEGHR